MATKNVGKKKVQIPELKTKMVKLTIEGTSPLLVNKFSEKSKMEMAEKQQKSPKNAKAARNPKAEYEASIYYLPNTKKPGIPASGIKNAIVSACRFVDGLPMSIATGALHVHEDSGGLVEIKGKPVFDERIVRIGKFGNKVATPRYRARFDEWSCQFKVEYNEDVINAEQIVHLLDNAGFAVGLCEHRPEKRGSLGRFRVQRG